MPTFLAAGYWQLTRALGGNTLSWAYVFEWPIFAGYLVHVWWRLLHDQPTAAPPVVVAAGAGAPAPAPPSTVAPGSGEGSEEESGGAEEEDEELAAYNRYLAALEDSGRRKRW